MTGSYLQEKVYAKIKQVAEKLAGAQGTDGAWRYCFESGTVTDAYMIILLRHLNIRDEAYISQLVDRIISRQQRSGAWKLFYDEPRGNLSATVECYYALLLVGYSKDSPVLKKAGDFIRAMGGPHEAGSLTRVMLALTGHYDWNNLPDIPVEIVLLPTWFPVNFYDFVGYARVHSAPILICAASKYSHKLPGYDLTDLYPSGSRQAPHPESPQLLQSEIAKLIQLLPFPLSEIRNMAMKKLERFMLARTESDGTLYSYFTSTFLMIFALLALGYDSGHPVILKAVEGLRAMSCHTGDNFHQQETTSTVWDTALVSYALQEARFLYDHPVIAGAAAYLLSRQHTKYGDWQVHNHEGRPGGWGFSHSNTMNPDVDDTTYVLRALYRQASHRPETCGPAWKAGLDWVLSMQNNDGGWPAFEKNTDKKWPEMLPMPDAKPVLTDPSSADLTGRTLEFLGRYAGLSLNNSRVGKGVRWLLQNQCPDGSWYGRWGIAYIYGTWAAVTGLTAVGVSPQHQAIQKAVNWLLSVQNPDGGWGESCLSDSALRYIPLDFSTPSQTAWALDALVAAGMRESPAVSRGMETLLALVDKDDPSTGYPTGTGLPGGFYIHYHSYRYVWPLVTMSHYLS